MLGIKVIKKLEEAASKIEAIESDDKRFARSLNEKSLGFLLEQEGQAQAVVQDVNDAADLAVEEIDGVLSKLPSGKFANLRSAMENAKQELAAARLAGDTAWDQLFQGGEKGVNKTIRTITNAGNLLSSISQASRTALGSLKDLGAKLDDEEKDKPIGALIDQYSSGEEQIGSLPSKPDFMKSMAKSLKTPESAYGGFATKLKGMFGKLFGGGKDIGFGMTEEQFINDMLELTAGEFDQFMKGASAALDDAAEAGGDDPISQVIADLEGSGVDVENLDTPQEPPSDEEGYAINRDDLKALKTAMDDAKSKKKSQSRALGGALNQALGKTVFAERTLYNLQEAKLILGNVDLVEEKFVRSQLNEAGKNEIDEEALLRYNLMKMAKLI